MVTDDEGVMDMAKTYQLPRTPVIGEIYLMTFDGAGSEQKGCRPGLIFQNNLGNLYSPNVIALPLTSATNKASLPTHVLIKACDGGLHKDSVVLCENPERMSKNRILKYITKLSEDDMKRVTEASLLATSAISFLDPDSILRIWENAVRLNNRTG